MKCWALKMGHSLVSDGDDTLLIFLNKTKASNYQDEYPRWLADSKIVQVEIKEVKK